MGERRRTGRQRTRLRPGKIYLRDTQFLCDCAILDLCDGGLQLRIFADTALPDEMAVLDERDARLWPARRVWQAGRSVGLAFEAAGARSATLDRRHMNGIAGPYYAAGEDPESLTD